MAAGECILTLLLLTRLATIICLRRSRKYKLSDAYLIIVNNNPPITRHPLIIRVQTIGKHRIHFTGHFNQAAPLHTARRIQGNAVLLAKVDCSLLLFDFLLIQIMPQIKVILLFCGVDILVDYHIADLTSVSLGD